MKRLGFIAVLAMLLVGFSATAASAAVTTTIDPAAAPQGTHLQTGAIGCTVNADQSVSCTTFELAGVGNTNATLNVTATYSATIDCRNKGGQVVETKTGTFTVTSPPVTLTSEKNGRLVVPSAG